MNMCLKILPNISVIIGTKNMLPIPLLVFHLVQAFGTAKGFVNLMTKSNDSVFFNFKNFCAPVNFDKAVLLL